MKINIFCIFILLVLLTGCFAKSIEVINLVNDNYDEIVKYATCDWKSSSCRDLSGYEFSSSVIGIRMMLDADANINNAESMCFIPTLRIIMKKGLFMTIKIILPYIYHGILLA